MIRGAIQSLASGSAVWQLKVSCLQHCRFVHSHHTHESMMLFPALRQANPALNPVVDKLEADHAHVSDLLDEVEAASHQLGEAGEPAARQRLASALRTLSDDLLAHLQYEEEQISAHAAHLDPLARLVRPVAMTAADRTAAGRTAVQLPGAPHDEQACAQAWAALTTAHAVVTEQLSAALTRTCGLSINEFQIMLRVDRAAGPGGVRLGELCSAVRLTQPSLSRAVARLERHGWLRRAGAPGDGRGVMVTLTAAGREVLAQGSGVHAQTIGELLLDRLTPDEQDLLARALEPGRGRPPGSASRAFRSATT